MQKQARGGFILYGVALCVKDKTLYHLYPQSPQRIFIQRWSEFFRVNRGV